MYHEELILHNCEKWREKERLIGSFGMNHPLLNMIPDHTFRIPELHRTGIGIVDDIYD